MTTGRRDLNLSLIPIARLSEADGEYRLGGGGGEMLQAPLSFSRTAGALRFDRSALEVADQITREGLESQVAITYGDVVPELMTLARILEVPVLKLSKDA